MQITALAEPAGALLPRCKSDGEAQVPFLCIAEHSD